MRMWNEDQAQARKMQAYKFVKILWILCVGHNAMCPQVVTLQDFVTMLLTWEMQKTELGFKQLAPLSFMISIFVKNLLQ